MALQIRTERLLLRPWQEGDAKAAFAAYGDAEIARWLTPELEQVPDEAAMSRLIARWMTEDTLTPAGRWAVELSDTGEVIGGATLLGLPPDDEHEVGWQLSRAHWGHGYATETGLALARYAFRQGLAQVIALVRPGNTRALATVRRMGMDWTGETEKYHGLRLQVFRLRPADLPAG
jgi:RimJ/RimL family protein N-acetyltransferase